MRDIQASVLQSMERELSGSKRGQRLGGYQLSNDSTLFGRQSVVRRRIAAAWLWITLRTRLPPLKRPQSNVECACCSCAAQALSCCLMECR